MFMPENKSVSLKSEIYEKILSMIINGDFDMDELLTENRFVSMFEVSRAPVREALIELCRDDILRNIPRAGYQIIRISEKKMRDAFQLREILEIEGLKLAFDRITDDNISELMEIAAESDRIRNTGKLEDSLEQKMRLNDQFHLRLNEFSGNQLMNRTLRDTFALIRRGLAQTMIHEYGHPSPSTTYHTGLATALRNRDLETACSNLRDDILCYKKNVWSLLI